MIKATSWAVLGFLLLGCGSGDGDAGDDAGSVSIASGPLTGKVGGNSWTLAGAQTDAFLSDESSFWVDLSATPLASCSAFGSGNSLILTVPKSVGTHRMGLKLNGTFVIENLETGGDNLIATNGAIRVDEITSALVRGGVSMTFDANNTVSGEFEAVVCAE